MCSSPKGSTTRQRQTKSKQYTQSDYQEYSTMVERASAVYDRIEKDKAERKDVLASQDEVITNSPVESLASQDNSQLKFFSKIKYFFLKPSY